MVCAIWSGKIQTGLMSGSKGSFGSPFVVFEDDTAGGVLSNNPSLVDNECFDDTVCCLSSFCSTRRLQFEPPAAIAIAMAKDMEQVNVL